MTSIIITPKIRCIKNEKPMQYNMKEWACHLNTLPQNNYRLYGSDCDINLINSPFGFLTFVKGG